MTDPRTPTPFLATSGRRALAAGLIQSSAVTVDDPYLVADCLDYLASAVLLLAGVDPVAGRLILATLWDVGSPEDQLPAPTGS